jgi:N-acetylmuramoyl-L-alanine amidase
MIKKIVLISFLMWFNHFIIDTYMMYSNDTIKIDTIINQNDVFLLARLINSESHSESFFDKLSAGSVVLNRMKSDEFPNTIDSVIYQESQFSGINTKLFTDIDLRDSLTQQAYLAAYQLLRQGPMNDALYFINSKKATNKKWAIQVKGRKKVLKTENHVYYK